MNDELALAPKDWKELTEMSKALAGASILPAALKQSPQNTMVIIMTGRELGMGPMQSVRGIHIIEGKPSLSADLMAGLCLSKRDICEYITVKESTDARATYAAKRKGVPDAVVMSFTIEQARAAGLVGKDTWKKYPAAMLRARALSAISRAVFPDLVGGLYDPDELDAAKDVTPAAAPTEVVESVKADMKKRRMTIIESTAVETPAPGAVEEDDPDTVGWGKNGHLRLADLTTEQLTWYVADAKAKSDKGDATFAARLVRYQAALDALVVPAAEIVQ